MMVALRARPFTGTRVPYSMAPGDVHPFGALLRQLRVRVSLSQNQLARQAGIDGAYVNRLERATPSSSSLPSRHVVLALAATLEALESETEQLLIYAGHCPEAIAKATHWEPVVGQIVDVLADTRLDDADLDSLRDVLRIMVEKWRPASLGVEG